MNAQMILTIFLLLQGATDVIWLEKLVSILSIALVTLLSLLILNLYKVYQLKKEIKTLKE